jgi:hypothetical protein
MQRLLAVRKRGQELHPARDLAELPQRWRQPLPYASSSQKSVG